MIEEKNLSGLAARLGYTIPCYGKLDKATQEMLYLTFHKVCPTVLPEELGEKNMTCFAVRALICRLVFYRTHVSIYKAI